MGPKFRRQHSVDYYILDFYCPEHKLGIEVDGRSHLKKGEYDKYRTKYLSAYDIKIIRFMNSEVEEGLDFVLEKIKALIPS